MARSRNCEEEICFRCNLSLTMSPPNSKCRLWSHSVRSEGSILHNSFMNVIYLAGSIST